MLESVAAGGGRCCNAERDMKEPQPSGGVSTYTSSRPQGADPGSHEYRRLRALLRYYVARDPSPTLDRICRLAASTFQVPIAFVSPMAQDHQWIKAGTGMPLGLRIPRETTFCRDVVAWSRPLVIPNTLEHPEYCTHPDVVDGPGVRFYAGAPLISDEGYAIGTICIADTEPRTFDDEDVARLEDFAALCIGELENQRQSRDVREVKKLARLGHWLYDVQANEVSWDAQACRMLGWSGRVGISRFNDFVQSIRSEDQTTMLDAVGESLRTGERQHARFRIPVKGGKERTLQVVTSTERPSHNEIPLIMGTLQDVTELAEAESALSGSEARYRSLVEDHPNFVQRFEPDTTVLYTNSALAAFRGRPVAELIGRPWLGMIPEADRLEVLEFLERFTPERPTGSLEARCIRGDGEIRWTQWTNRAFFDSRGRIEYFQAVGLDIHDRKEAEAALAEKERLLRRSYEQLDKLADNAPGFLYQFRRSPGGSYSFPYVSHGVREMLGVSRETAEQDAHAVLERIHPDDQERFYRSLDESVDKLSVWQMVFRIQPPDSEPIWVEGHSTPERQDDGSILWHGSIRDVTDRKQAWDALYESEERFRQLAERIEEVFWLRTPERLLYVNPAYQRIWGHPLADLYANPDSFISSIHPEDQERVLTAQRRHLEHDLPFDETYRIRRTDDGSERWIRSRSYMIDRATLRTAGTASDVTAIKEYEQELERLASTDRLTGLWNRVHFDGEMQRALERLRRHEAPSTLLLFDLDHFKRINDEHGHVAGDEILRAVTRTVREKLRITDIFARWGGEEFALLLPDTAETHAHRLAERIREHVAALPLPPAGHVTISCGLTELRADDAHDAVVQRADEALYRAKRSGRNRTELG